MRHEARAGGGEVSPRDNTQGHSPTPAVNRGTVFLLSAQCFDEKVATSFAEVAPLYLSISVSGNFARWQMKHENQVVLMPSAEIKSKRRIRPRLYGDSSGDSSGADSRHAPACCGGTKARSYKTDWSVCTDAHKRLILTSCCCCFQFRTFLVVKTPPNPSRKSKHGVLRPLAHFLQHKRTTHNFLHLH